MLVLNNESHIMSRGIKNTQKRLFISQSHKHNLLFRNYLKISQKKHHNIKLLTRVHSTYEGNALR